MMPPPSGGGRETHFGTSSTRAVATVMLAVLVFMLLAVPAQAQGQAAAARLTLMVRQAVEVGEAATLEARLTDASGAPVVGAVISFSSSAVLLGVSNEVKLGEATTETSGFARLTFEPRQAGEVTLSARFAGDKQYDPAESSVVVNITGARQLYQPTAGIRVPVPGPWLGQQTTYHLDVAGTRLQVPFIGRWMLEGILGGVWVVYIVIMALLWGIARGGSR